MHTAEIEALLDDLERHLKGHDGKDLPNGQRAVLYACLSDPGLTYKQMPKKLLTEAYGSFSWKTLKNDASTIFGRLSDLLKADVKKKNCHRRLLDWHQHQHPTPPSPSPSSPPPEPTIEHQPPQNLIRFQCWEKDLANIEAAIYEGRRIVGITGSECVGKTYLTHVLIEQIKPKFDAVVQCHAFDVQTLERLYDRVLQRLPDGYRENRYGENGYQGNGDKDGSAIAPLFEILHTRRILLVIDQAEILFQPKALAGQFRRECMAYEHWLKRLLSSLSHAGCLLWVGREPPACFEYPHSILYKHTISKLHIEDAATLLNARDIPVDAMDGWETLLDFCGGNLAWLLVVASLVRTRSQDIHTFLSSPPPSYATTVRDGLERLSLHERILLFWLLLKPLSYPDIHQIHVPEISSFALEDALRSLERRDLVRQDDQQCYRVRSPLLEHVLAQMVVTQIEEEISSGNITLLCQHPLLHGSAPAWRQEWQQTNVLQPLGDRFRRHFGFRHEQTAQLQRLLSAVKEMPDPQGCYAISNLLNLAMTLNLPLADFEISGLPLCHVDLRRANLSHANLESCTFQETLLPLNLEGALTAHIAPDGRAIALGDKAGHLLYWKRDTSLRLQSVYTLPTSIESLLFQDRDTLIVVSQQSLYSWWLGGEAAPKKIMDLEAPVSYLAQSRLGTLALGLKTGSIILWDEFRQLRRILNAHTNAICNLSFGSDGYSLASIGFGNRVLVWDLASEADPLIPNREVSSGSQLCLACAWDQDTLLRAEVNGSQVYLRTEHTLLADITIPDGNIIELLFSTEGRYLLGGSEEGILFCWDWKARRVKRVRKPHAYPVPLGICGEGRGLLAKVNHALALYDLDSQELIWQARTNASARTPFNLRHAQQLTPAERQMLRSLGAEI